MATVSVMSEEGNVSAPNSNEENASNEEETKNPEIERSNEEARKRHEEEVAMMNSRRERKRATSEEVQQYALELHNAIHRIGSEPLGPGFFFGDLMGIVKTGFDVAENLLKMGGLIKGNAKWKDLVKNFTSIFDWGKAIYGIFDIFTSGGGDDSEKDDGMEKIQKELAEIANRLESIEETIRQGFKDLIAHSDTAYFREKIGTPAQTLFDRMQRCQRAITETTTKDFLDDCSRYPPGHLLTAIYKFLEAPGNGLWTQLEASNYSYETYKQWTINHTMVQLSILDMFYYGMRLSHEKKSDSEKERFQTGEEQEMVFQLDRIQRRLDDIEWDRVKKFIRGDAKVLLKELSTQAVKEVDKEISQEQMNQLAKKLTEEWEKRNGNLVPFGLIIWRGKLLKEDNFGGDNGLFRFAHYSSDGDEMVIVENLYDIKKQEENGEKWLDKYPRWDNLQVALIQPVTESMFNNQNKSNNMMETLDIARTLMSRLVIGSPYFTAETLNWKYVNSLFNDLKKIEKKPLLILYNSQLAEGPLYTGPSFVYDTPGQDAVGGTENMKLIPVKIKFGQRALNGRHIHMHLYFFFQDCAENK